MLKNYFLLTFPTKFYTEGVPGTILDAYAAGVPVIASKWESFFDVIEEGKTGIGYEFDNQKELEKTLEEISSTPRTIIEKKYKCIEKAKEYLPRVAIRSLLERL